MDHEKIPITLRGYHGLSSELDYLKNVERPNIIRAIAEAREHGDLSENAEYHAARERQGFVEGRIVELEDKLSRSEVIDVEKIGGSHVQFGATVTLKDQDNHEIVSYQIVGSDEADVRNGFLSIASPLARSLIGKTAHEEIEVPTPNGGRAYIIQKIEYC
jgi:transcription elongation factor GreA